MQANWKDVTSGAFFAAVGLLYGSIAWQSLALGTAFNMGPGYFPIVLSGILIVLGAFVSLRALSEKQTSPFGALPWRGIIMLSLATMVFAAFFEELGMLPGIFLTTFLAALSSPQIRIARAAVTSLCIAIFCTAVFSYGIHLPVPVVGSIFGM